jgi:hypothetical protein
VSKDFCFFHPRDPQQGPIKSTLNKRAIRTIVSAIQEAWREIETFEYWKSSPFQQRHFADEDELSTKLMEILNDRLSNNMDGNFRKEVFQTVVRDAKQSTASVNSIDQMPDLTFRMIQSALGEDRDESALFVEAKLVDQASGCRQYVVNGVYRFVSGKYAPRMTFGLMLGYATADFDNASKHLPTYYYNATSDEARLCSADVTVSDIHSACFASDHVREKPCPPDFRALHLWLIRP